MDRNQEREVSLILRLILFILPILSNSFFYE